MAIGIFDRVYKNMKQINTNEIEEAMRKIREANFIAGTSSGRAERAMEVPIGEYVRNSRGKAYHNFNDNGFPGDTFDIAAPKLGDMYGKCVAVFVSSSGESDETYTPLDQLKAYLAESKIKNWDVVTFTQDPNSTAAKLTKDVEGTVVSLRGSENKHSKNYRELGMMRQDGEEQSLWSIQLALQAIKEGRGVDRFFELVDERMPVVFSQAESWSNTELCKRLIKEIQRCRNIFVGGRKGAEDVSKYLLKRIYQEKMLANDDSYLYQGSTTPNPRIGDVFIPTSKSGGREDFYSPTLKGKTSHILRACKKFKKIGASVFPFTAVTPSPIEKECGSENTTVVNSMTMPDGYSDAYARIMIHHDIIPIILAEEYDKAGFDISPQNLRRTHGF